jgi:hypothetical protein
MKKTGFSRLRLETRGNGGNRGTGNNRVTNAHLINIRTTTT